MSDEDITIFFPTIKLIYNYKGLFKSTTSEEFLEFDKENKLFIKALVDFHWKRLFIRYQYYKKWNMLSLTKV